MFHREAEMVFDRTGLAGSEVKSALSSPKDWILRYIITYLLLIFLIVKNPSSVVLCPTDHQQRLN